MMEPPPWLKERLQEAMEHSGLGKPGETGIFFGRADQNLETYVQMRMNDPDYQEELRELGVI